MTYDEGKALIKRVREYYNTAHWNMNVLEKYFEEIQGGYVRYDGKDNIVLDGRFTVAELEAVLIALHNEKGAMRG